MNYSVSKSSKNLRSHSRTNLYVNAYFERLDTKVAEFTSDYIEDLLHTTEVEFTEPLDFNDVVPMMFLDRADRLLRSLKEKDIKARVGVTYGYSNNYPQWTLIVETENMNGVIHPLVARFFNWDRIESNSVLSLDKILEGFYGYLKSHVCNSEI